MLVCVNKAWYRPTDVDNLWGDPTKAKEKLGWNPRKTGFGELVRLMVAHDMRKVRKLYLRSLEDRRDDE